MVKRIRKFMFVSGLLVSAAGAYAAAGLEPAAMTPLPTGAVMPEGWLKVQLDQMADGLCGHLHEYSRFLTPTNGWLRADGAIGWEEQPYWFRGFVKTAALTGDKRLLAVAKDWVEKILATRDGDGWYGPRRLKNHRCRNGKKICDIWGHMVMNEALISWHEYTGDKRVFDMLLGFYRYLSTLDETQFIPSYADQEGSGSWTWGIQTARAGDILPGIYQFHEKVKEPWLLDLAFRAWNHRERPALFMNNHNVNFAQLFGYGTVMYRLTRRPADRESAAYWFDLHMKAWGSTPRCGFAADEVVRIGCTDPRYGTETCTWAEFIRSFGLVGSVTGDTVWGDRTEDVMFNWYPIAYTPGWKELHYITAGNQVNLDVDTDHNYCNLPPQAAYSSRSYRCCRHNAHFGLPHFCESLVMKDRSGALDFWLYAPHRGRAEMPGGKTVSWKMETRYPFRETVKLSIDGEAAVRLRVPGWCRRFEVKRGGETVASADGGGWLDLGKVGGGAFDIAMKADCSWRDYPRHGGVSLERGPLTYSLAIKPVAESVRGGDFVQMKPASGSRWNFALDKSFSPVYRELAFDEDCFRFANASAEILVKGRRLPQWTLQDNQPAELQESPAYTEEPLEDLRFIPMCCARLHLTVLPEATTDAKRGFVWKKTPPFTERAKRPKAMPQ
ncbi:MAG: glycoside hydrolase family 127 protein [Kiritimatiellae bacterium]|nr:glycoside hydrolase family 127 protein [Kiritimatiellia bacterium]